MPEVRVPVGAQTPQIGGHDTTGKVGDGAWWAQHQHAGVIRDQVQAGKLLALPPAVPLVARTALEGARLPAEQSEPAALVFGDVAQPAPGESAEPQRVMLGHGGIPPPPLVGPRQPHGHVLDRHWPQPSCLSATIPYILTHAAGITAAVLYYIPYFAPWHE